MLKNVIDVAVPLIVFFTMIVVGTELTAPDFLRVARQPLLVAVALVGQVLLLPLLAMALLGVVRLEPSLQAGILLVAACPTGPMANLYTFLARGDVALSVSLTGLSCLA